jgi:hypothetical protein
MGNTLVAINDIRSGIEAGKNAREIQGQALYDNTNLVRALALNGVYKETFCGKQLLVRRGDFVTLPASLSSETQLVNKNYDFARILEGFLGRKNYYTLEVKIWEKLSLQFTIGLIEETSVPGNLLNFIDNSSWVSDFSTTINSFTVSLITSSRTIDGGSQNCKTIRFLYNTNFYFDIVFVFGSKTPSNIISDIRFLVKNTSGASSIIFDMSATGSCLTYGNLFNSSISKLETLLTFLESYKTTFTNIESFLE